MWQVLVKYQGQAATIAQNRELAELLCDELNKGVDPAEVHVLRRRMMRSAQKWLVGEEDEDSEEDDERLLEDLVSEVKAKTVGEEPQEKGDDERCEEKREKKGNETGKKCRDWKGGAEKSEEKRASPGNPQEEGDESVVQEAAAKKEAVELGEVGELS